MKSKNLSKQTGDLSPQYIAGLFDGEGTIAAYRKGGKRKDYSFSVSIYNGYMPVLEKLRERFGGYVFASKNGGTWQLSGVNNIKLFIDYIIDYSIVKHSQLKLGLLYIQTANMLHNQRLTEEVRSRRELICELLKAEKVKTNKNYMTYRPDKTDDLLEAEKLRTNWQEALIDYIKDCSDSFKQEIVTVLEKA